MYDVEMMQMLSLIHNENQMIFEMCKGITPEFEKIMWDNYQKCYDDIMNGVYKYSNCNDCEYKSREDKIKEVLNNKGDKLNEIKKD